MSARLSRAQPSRRFVDRVVSAFVEPAEEAEPVAVVAAVPLVAVLCRAEDVWVTGGAVALAERGPAVVVAWGDGIELPSARAPASRAARRLATVLSARGHAAAATARLVQVVVEDPSIEVGRIAAAADPARCVTVLAGPRDEAIDALLRSHDDVLVDAGDDVADLALTSLAQADIPVQRLSLGHTPATARALAAAGLALSPSLRAAVR